MIKHRKASIALTAVLGLTTLLAGCGGNTASAPAPSSGSAPSANNPANFKVGLVTDIGGLNDHSFNHLAYVGLMAAKKKYGVTVSVVQSHSNSDYLPNLTNYAQQGYKLVIAVGFLMQSAVAKVSKEYPKTKFMIIDDQVNNRKNVMSSLFETQQCGYLVGVMAGLMNKEKGIPQINGKNVVGVVGGMNIPPVESYIAGFQAGVHKVNPSAKVIVEWANSFTDPSLGKLDALNEISQGADIVFPVAGATGNGAITAAQEKNVFAIGVDANQNYLAPHHVMTSALKAVDVATETAIGDALNGKFKSGPQYFTLANKGVGYAPPIAAVPASIVKQVNSYIPLLESGKINPPSLLPSS